MKIYKKRIWIFIVLGIAIVVSLTLIEIQYDANLNKQDAKKRSDSLRIISLMKEHSKESQRAWKFQGKSSAEEDAEAPHEIDDKEELAQAMMWQKLSPQKRLSFKPQ